VKLQVTYVSKKSGSDGPVSRRRRNDFHKLVTYFDVDVVDRHQTTED